MMANSKTDELNCKGGDMKCLCQNKDFLYGLRDCSQAVCGSDDAGVKAAVDYGMSVCAGKPLSQKVSPRTQTNYHQQVLALRLPQVVEAVEPRYG